MSKKVLILNQDYSALGICSVSKAFLLVYLGKAELVAESEQEYLRTISSCFPMPTVIRLHRYINLPYKGVVLTRQNIFRRDGNQCTYCGKRDDLTLDHVLPKSRGGKSSWDNLTTACKHCNAKKGHETPEEAAMPLRVVPYKPTFLMFIREFSGTPHESWRPFLGRK